MKDNNKKYWKGIEELSNDPTFLKHANNEFPEYLPIKDAYGDNTGGNGPDRRDFLKLLGFGVAAVSLAACDAPVKRVIPYVNKPEEIDPGIANWYSSTYQIQGEYCSVVVKTREGRPIKIEGNNLSSVTNGGTSARVQASVLSLYDTTKLKNFLKEGKTISVDLADSQITAKLQEIQNSGLGIRIVSNTILSPSTKSVISDFIAKYSATSYVVYDPISAFGMREANKASFGKSAIPSYDFSKANIIVSFDADFLGTWIAPIEYASQYAKTRKVGKNKKVMSRHYQFESHMSISGANADHRIPIKPSQEGLFIAALYNRLTANKIGTPDIKNDALDRAAKDLLANKGKSIVVAGSNDKNVQILVNQINNLLGNYGKTININQPTYFKQGDDQAFQQFVQEVKAGRVGGVIFLNSNPVYDSPFGQELAEGLKKVALKISTADRVNETAAYCDYICPDTHFLESWDDAQPKEGFFSLAQPTITRIFKGTRSAQESLLNWSGKNQEYYFYIQDYWKKNILTGGSFQENWDRAVQNGVYEPKGKLNFVAAAEVVSTGADTTGTVNEVVAGPTPSSSVSISTDLNSVATAINNSYKLDTPGLEIKFFEKITIGSGIHADNPWLQELPDPITKITWDNYLAVPISLSKQHNLDSGDLVRVVINGKPLKDPVPVVVQPGQGKNTVAIALGYGRERAGVAGTGIGANVYPYLTFKDGSIRYEALNVTFEKIGEETKLAQTQTHETLMARPIIQDTTFAEYLQNPKAGRFVPTVATPEGRKPAEEISLWSSEHKFPNHHWGMVIDLNSCIGCAACVVACNVENNIPVVGKKEVINRREMHWLRIDRYYSSDAEMPELKEKKYFEKDEEASYKDLENPAENPQVTFQPMLCQQCNHAPCETVCPVAATTHSSEGLNQMAYNRCVGTRYCQNNCPYKVRRFNWFKYFDNPKFEMNLPMNNALGKMVLNPDVTVRSRGVMEKCSFCVQRIQEGKLEAKKDRRRPVDGEIVTACASACPTNAIVFGDMNDPESKVTNQLLVENTERAYHVLGEIGTRPNIAYLTKIRNV